MSATYKLVSRKGTLLGTITIPDYEDQILRQQGGVQIAYMPCLATYTGISPSSPVVPEMVQVVTIHRSYCYEHHDAVEMYGVTLEEFEKMPGYSFAPSAAYLRSLIEGQ